MQSSVEMGAGHQGTYLDQSITVAGNRHFASYQAFRCFLSHKKAKVQKSRGGKERLKSHSSIHTSAKFIFVDYSGKHTSAVFHNSDYPLLHCQSEVLPEVPFIDPWKSFKAKQRKPRSCTRGRSVTKPWFSAGCRKNANFCLHLVFAWRRSSESTAQACLHPEEVHRLQQVRAICTDG